jgi:hypothetical protein
MTVRPVRYSVLAVVLAAGCSEPEAVRVLDEPPRKPAVKAVPPDQQKYRTFAALIPADSGADSNQTWWVFKMSGPADEVGKYAADFTAIIDSVKVTPDRDQPIDWKLPEKWTRGPEDKGGGMVRRVATLIAPDGKSEIAVTQAAGTVLMNVQRWYGQLWGADKKLEVTAANLPDHMRQRLVNGRFVIQVDLVGPKLELPKAGNPHNPHGGQ